MVPLCPVLRSHQVNSYRRSKFEILMRAGRKHVAAFQNAAATREEQLNKNRPIQKPRGLGARKLPRMRAADTDTVAYFAHPQLRLCRKPLPPSPSSGLSAAYFGECDDVSPGAAVQRVLPERRRSPASRLCGAMRCGGREPRRGARRKNRCDLGDARAAGGD